MYGVLFQCEKSQIPYLPSSPFARFDHSIIRTAHGSKKLLSADALGLFVRENHARERNGWFEQNHPSNICTVHRSARILEIKECKQQLKQKHQPAKRGEREPRDDFLSFLSRFFHLAIHMQNWFSLRERAAELLSYDGVAHRASQQ